MIAANSTSIAGLVKRNVALFCGGLLAASISTAQSAGDPTVYGNVVAPILNAKCVSCHGPDKKKGKFAMHTMELLLKGGSSEEKALVPNHSDQSEIFVRIMLPEDDEDHMPPEGKDQLTEEEVATIKWWIDSGASEDAKLEADKVPADIKEFVVKVAADNPEGVVLKEVKKDTGPVVPAPTAEQEAAIAKIQEELNVVILPVSQDNPGLTFTAVNVAKEFDDAKLARFDPLAGNLLQANIARSKVTDAGLGTVSKMKNLTRLRLEKTEVTDAGLDHLAGLENLEYLNLYGTKVSDEGLSKLEGLKKLKRLYLWQTAVTEDGAKNLAAKLPDLLINLGWDKEIGKKPEITRIPAIEIPDAKPDPETTYGGLIHPIFEAKCAGCHGKEKQKGKLALQTLENLMKGGKSGKTVVAGKSAESELVKRIDLPADDDDHMPPKDKDQLTKKEIALIKWWIDSGADGEAKVADAQVPASILLLK